MDTVIPDILNERFDELRQLKSAMLSEEIVTECCPSEERLIHPLGGRSSEGKLLELYRDSRTFQRFHERRCRKGVVNKPCNWVDRKYLSSSRCVQKHNYVYALVKDFNVTEPYRLDFIRIRSGCSCEIDFNVSTQESEGWLKRNQLN